jgi:serine/threonine-protein kinase RsbT
MDDIRLDVRSDADTVLARTEALRLARQLGFSDAEAALVAIAMMEVANNLVRHAGQGTVVIAAIRRNGQQGISITARDDGPGIPDVARAMRDGYSTDGGLGKGLAAITRMVDELEIESAPGTGTVVTLRKYVEEAP